MLFRSAALPDSPGQPTSRGSVGAGTFALIDFQPGFLRKDAGHQRLQQGAHFQGYPVCLIVRCDDAQLVIVEVPGRPKRRDVQNRRRIAADCPL